MDVTILPGYDMRELAIKQFIFFSFFLNFFCSTGQNSIQLTNYYKGIYLGGNQNWDISIGDDGDIFVANNNGLLVYDGAQWTLNQLPNQTIIRSVEYDKGRIYTGSFEEFGYWERNASENWYYTSLIPLVKNFTFQNDEIWKIIKHDHKIYFQSFGALFVYDYSTIQNIPIPGPILFLLQADDHLFVQQINGGLFEISNAKLRIVNGSNIFANTEIKAIIKLNENKLLIGTSTKGIFEYDGNTFRIWACEGQVNLIRYKLNNGIRSGNKVVIGTIQQGIFIYDLTGKLIHHLNTDAKLQNNTILTIESDKRDNLWVGMDKGIDFVSFNSPITVYEDSKNHFGSVYCASMYKGELFVGTNQGIFVYEPDSEGIFSPKGFINNSQGQVWFIKELDDKLYCGLNDGTYQIENYELIRISSISGGYNLTKIYRGEPEYLVQSTYSSVVYYKRINNQWQFSHTLYGFIAPSRYLEVDYKGSLWLGHSVKGVYLVEPNQKCDSVSSIKRIDSFIRNDVIKNQVFKVDNRIVIPSSKTLYRWDDVKYELIQFTELNSQLEGFDQVNTIVPISSNKYWFIKKNEIALFEVFLGKAKLLYRIIPEMYDLKLIEGYENIVELNDSLHLICLDNGFALLNIYMLNQIIEVNEAPRIKSIIARTNKGKYINAILPGKFRIPNKYNNISISFSSNEPLGGKKYYQYKLEGLDEKWSDWSTKSNVNYTRLPKSSYTFKVRTLNAKGIITNQASYSFRILPPWYLSAYAYILYVVAFLGFGILLRFYIKRRIKLHKESIIKREYEKAQRERELAEQQIVKLTNDKLESEISNKNSQLANSTIAIIKKNELLIEIQTEFENLKKELGYRIPNKYYDKISALIEQNITSEHDWQMFEQLFDQAHQNFFKRLKSSFPDLTPSDLRLCAYLRMNLSSKEIAPLINITIRGVEERRYRLRKRLNLSADKNLTEFIMEF